MVDGFGRSLSRVVTHARLAVAIDPSRRAIPTRRSRRRILIVVETEPVAPL